MQSLMYKKVRDREVLSQMVGYYVEIFPLFSELKNSYRKYVIAKASPSIVPIAITDSQRKTFESAYRNRPESVGLGWIDDITYNGLPSCPFCGGDGARTIEHFLPQASFPEFSVLSLNLAPSCGDCNRKRNNQNEHGAPLKLLHPYFDYEILKLLDLYTEVTIKSGVPSFRPQYNRSDFDDDQKARIDHHIDVNIDEVSYINKNISWWVGVQASAERCVTVKEFREKVIDENLYVLNRMGAINSWSQALYKGVGKLNDKEIEMLFSDCFGKRI